MQVNVPLRSPSGLSLSHVASLAVGVPQAHYVVRER